MVTNHPCLSCGACCAFFRVSFHWSEVLRESHGVPEATTEKISLHKLSMIGTNQKKIRCGALKGVIGDTVNCEIYANRPSPCRSFSASFEDGEPDDRCDRARNGHGLKPLVPADWAQK
ncbi:MAG: YkgJ family cysteine cluster protein [Moraxellaceae bacterium]|nr:YkgJ family cysteine cluster protein [Pseudobdellovibrionaceae bacterium]